MKQILSILSFLISCQFTLAQPSEDATAIVRKADEKFRGESQYAEMRMEIHRPSWSREIQMKTWSLKKDYSLILITAPAKEKGQAFLKRGNEIWNWIPNIERLVKLPPSMMMQSWMGSDFKNNDLIRESSIVTDYNHKLVQTTEHNGSPCYQIKMTPKEDAPVVWSKVITWIHKEDYYQLRSEFYGENGELVDVMKFSNVGQLGDRKLPRKMTMIPQEKENHKTVIQYKEADFGVDLTPEFFSKQKMKSMGN